jgi:hypothetical protein
VFVRDKNKKDEVSASSFLFPVTNVTRKRFWNIILKLSVSLHYKMEQETNSLKQTARLAGLFYLLQVLTIGFNLGYVRSTLIVAGDAAATAANITANESLFRMAMASNIISQIFLFFFGLTVFKLFKDFNKTLATFFLTSLLLSVGIAVVNSINNFAALLVLSNADYLKAFQPEQLKALMMIFLKMSNSGVGFFEVFSGLFLISLGLLLIKSRYIPRILGILLVIGGCWFQINTFTKILIPQFYPAMITQLTMLFNALGGIPLIFWLLTKGVNEQQQINEDENRI